MSAQHHTLASQLTQPRNGKAPKRQSPDRWGDRGL